MWSAHLSKTAFLCSPKECLSTTNLKQKYFAYGWLWIRSSGDNEDKCLVADFLGCPFLTTSGPLELESVMSSCWICSSRRALHTPEQVQWAGTTSLHKHNYASKGAPHTLESITTSLHIMQCISSIMNLLHLWNTRLKQLLCICTNLFLQKGPLHLWSSSFKHNKSGPAEAQ